MTKNIYDSFKPVVTVLNKANPVRWYMSSPAVMIKSYHFHIFNDFTFYFPSIYLLFWCHNEKVNIMHNMNDVITSRHPWHHNHLPTVGSQILLMCDVLKSMTSLLSVNHDIIGSLTPTCQSWRHKEIDVIPTFQDMAPLRHKKTQYWTN